MKLEKLVVNGFFILSVLCGTVMAYGASVNDAGLMNFGFYMVGTGILGTIFNAIYKD